MFYVDPNPDQVTPPEDDGRVGGGNSPIKPK